MANDSDDWQNVVIETGVDTLLDYLAENGEASVSQISEDMGVSESRIKKWAKALEDNRFVERTYSARKGMILHYTKSSKKNVDEKLEEVKKQVDEETSRINQEMESRQSEVKKAKEQLKEMSKKLEENREEEEKVKNRLNQLEDLEDKLERNLDEQKEKEDSIHSESINLLSQIDNALNRIDEAEGKAETFEDKQDEVRKKVKALKKLQKHSEKVEDLDRELKELEDKEDESKGVFSSFKSKLGSIFGTGKEKDILDGNVDEVKDRIRGRDIDIDALIEKEKNGENRKTLLEFLERQKE
ncbi:MAG: hypothetical protein ABEJ99_01460 [Candidatus Nanohaloarchaea archaeon]